MLSPAVDLLGAAVAYALPAGLASSPANRSVRVYKRLRDADRVALTFDDGPQPFVLEQFLKLLEREKVNATFFVVGKNVRVYPELIRAAWEAGHEIANHGFTHRAQFLSNPLRIPDDIERGANAIAEAIGTRPQMYRPPHGVVTASTRFGAWRAQSKLVLWTRWGRDWRPAATPDSIARKAVSRVRGGDIVLLHDADQYGTEGSWRKTLAALPSIIDRIREAGLTPSPIGGASQLTW